MTRVFGFTSLCATPTFILVCEQKVMAPNHNIRRLFFSFKWPQFMLKRQLTPQSNLCWCKDVVLPQMVTLYRKYVCPSWVNAGLPFLKIDVVEFFLNVLRFGNWHQNDAAWQTALQAWGKPLITSLRSAANVSVLNQKSGHDLCYSAEKPFVTFYAWAILSDGSTVPAITNNLVWTQ